MGNLEAITRKLKSEKIKDRQEGLTSIKETFSKDKVLNTFGVNKHGKLDPGAWLALFQALFVCCLQEKSAATKKTTQSLASAEKRLAETARTIRWMVERTKHLMTKKVSSAVFDHLQELMIHRGRLLGPVVLDYVKALQTMLDYGPHLDHLEEYRWMDLVTLSFNVILGDPVKDDFGEDDGLDTTEGVPSTPASTEDADEMYVDNTDEDEYEGTSRTKKRRRTETPPPSGLRQGSTQPRATKASTNQITVTPEQIAFMTLLATLISSPSSPFSSNDYQYLTSSVLNRLHRFLQRYPTDTTLHHDFLRVLTSTLTHISYNDVDLMTTFTYKSWDNLVKLWATKNKTLKEGLISVFRMLFPFLTLESRGSQCSEMLWNMWNALSVEAESKWGLDLLSMESLRFELSLEGRDMRGKKEAFVANVFRAGCNFDRPQAMMWSILELQADCMEKLYHHSESMLTLSAPARPTQTQRKRARFENPLSIVLSSIRAQMLLAPKIYHLQILLFFIDRHWSVLHREMKSEVFTTLLQFISVDDKDGMVQNWIMLCFAAIASNDFSSGNNSPYLSSPQSLSFSLPTTQMLRDATPSWEQVWTHAIRRTNISALCRTACHTALVILSHPNIQSTRGSFSRSPLSPQRAVTDIETMLKDLDVQGPSSPYDSVCAFLSTCLRVVNQDVRVFRMQLEEKVLSWLTGFWQLGYIDVLPIQLYLVKDVLFLLETICSCSKRSGLLCNISLPPCLTVDTLVTWEKMRVIREFVLEARLPEFRPNNHRDETLRHADFVSPHSTTGKGSISEADICEPRAREKRISGFFLKSIESLTSQWQALQSKDLQPRAESVKQLLDIAVIALSFESVLFLNCIRWDKRLVHTACKLIGLVSPAMADSRWTFDEKCHVLQALEPLFSVGGETYDDAPWVAMLTAGKLTGIRYEVLRTLLPNHDRKNSSHPVTMEHLRVLWTNFEIQSCFTDILGTLRNLLHEIASDDVEGVRKAFDIDDRDGFGPIKTADTQANGVLVGFSNDKSSSIRFARMCINFMSVAPLLQSSSGEPTRDQELIQLILDSSSASTEVFLGVCPTLLDNVRNSNLYLSMNNLDLLFEEWRAINRMHAYSRSAHAQLLVIRLLDASMPLWISPSATNLDVVSKVQSIFTYLVNGLEKSRFAWNVRDSFARLLEKYIDNDPSQRFWIAIQDDKNKGEAEEAIRLPSQLLQEMNRDVDVRVRFRIVVTSARLFEFAARVGLSLMELYGQVLKLLPTDIKRHEHMVTRILSLGNIMIVSSAVRRGPYWHLLEAYYHAERFAPYLEATLKEVARRIGLQPFATLFESYASQMAYTIRRALHNILRVPPHLLGYTDHKERAVAAFPFFTPDSILARDNDPKIVEHGKVLFRGHCEAIQKRPEDGLRECFGDVFAYALLLSVSSSNSSLEAFEDQTFFEELAAIFRCSKDDVRLLLDGKVDNVISSILRTLEDQDFTADGPIMAALRLLDDEGASVLAFEKLTTYRSLSDFDVHEPNLPRFGTWAVLVAIKRVLNWVANVDQDALTYHVLQELFSSVESSPMVNEQLRLINAITVWITLQHSRFWNHTLLHTVIRGECSLLAQVELARSAQSILEWCFARYCENGHRDPRFPGALVRIACVCCDYSKDSLSVRVSALGTDLVSWIDAQAFTISELNTLAGQIQVALTVWPHPVPTRLIGLSSSLSNENLSKLLDENSFSSNKFRVVHRLLQETSSGAVEASHFAQSDFWNLKECIPSNDKLEGDDVLAFASLLLLNKGTISSFGSEQLLAGPECRQHVRGRRVSYIPTDMPERAIVISLLALLECGDAVRRHAAYRTLHALLVGLRTQLNVFCSWPSEYEDEVGFLGNFDSTMSNSTKRKLGELNSEDFLDASSSFEKWVGTTSILFSDILAESKAFYAQLPPILCTDASFAEDILPVLVQTLLQDPSESQSGRAHASILSSYFSRVLSSKATNVCCRRCIIEIVLHLRNVKPNSNDALAHEKWLTIDYLLLAQNAIACGAYTTALLFLELGDDQRRSQPPITPDAAVAYETEVEKVMYDIYANIDEPDGFYGIKTQNHHQFLMKRFHHEDQWEKAFRFHGAALEADTSNLTEAEGLLQSFHSYGFDHLATGTLLNTVAPEKPNLALTYQLGWRTETWDLPDVEDGHCSGASLYLALRAIHRERDYRVSENIVKDVLFREMGHLRSLGSENIAQIRETARNLMSLSQATAWMKQLDKLPDEVLEAWSDYPVTDSGFQFADICNIMATRISLLRSARHREERHQIGSMRSPLSQALLEGEKQCLIQLSRIAREARHSQIALNSVTRARKLEESLSPSFTVSEEHASVLWLHQEEKLAVDLLKDIRANLPVIGKNDLQPEEELRRALLNACIGSWAAEACLEKHTEIWKECFATAITLLQSTSHHEHGETRASVYHKAAIFAEHQYYAIVKSPETIRWKVYLERKQKDISILQEQRKRYKEGTHEHKELNGLIVGARKVMLQDLEANRRQSDSRKEYLGHSIEMYSRCLEESDKFDQDAPVRLCSLWLGNFDDAKMGEAFRVALERVPSRKFVFLAHQLTARLSADSPAQKNLHRLIFRMSLEHPFHSLYQVLLLNPPREDSGSSRRSSVRNVKSGTPSERANAAKEILDRIRNDADRQGRLLAIEQFCFAALQWADYPIKKNKDIKTGPYDIPSNMVILKLKLARLKVPVITVHTPVDPTMRYENCVWVDKYDSKYSTAGGLSKPKICVCRGSDGKPHKQLFKGEESDDLRQDAVMEQVFQLVNAVLQRDPETRRRHLRVRDYKVIPLDTQAGVLEFVNDTMPLRSWLTTAHVQYRPQDRKDVASWWSKLSANNDGKEIHKNPEERLRIYRETKKVLRPVMRYWFTEKHKTPISWFGMRLNYTRSVATTSIVGHILGLGDRHTSNILLDSKSGEVVHIDLGLAFDQGRLLPVPESVPFRMTEDMEDGMGMSGTEGVFQRCAEETMRVLREGSEVIMTVLEVFRHDPLHSWTMNDMKIQKIQHQSNNQTAVATANIPGLSINMASGNAEEDADRALSSVARKLDKTLSVATVVRGLVAEAKDPANLSSLYHGWGPYY
ncbi:hypothetical protein L218DRAFT_1074808 [Marasmius fiardii PR-910]|nr:hypothetical protein L218DRAFT_1074808 [Marasmius fiardii PR-910]